MSDIVAEKEATENRARKTVMRKVRFPVDVVEIINRRVDKYPGEMNFSRYVSMLVGYNVRRSHHTHKSRDRKGY